LKAYPYWWDTAPGIWTSGTEPRTGNLEPETRNPELPDRRRFDVLIVGAGYTGLSAARQLARAGASVAVLDRGRVGSGASSRNAGQVLTGLKLDVGTLVSKYGEARARELFEISGEAMAALERVVADERIDCDLERTGHLQAAAKPSHLRAFRDEQALLSRVFNHQVSIVEARDQSTELGARGYHGLLVDERSAAINPATYVHGLASAATRAGAVVFEHTAVSHLTRTANGWTITTARGDLGAREVLIATNGYTDEAAPALQRRLIPIGSYIICTAPLTGSLAAQLLPRRRMAFDSRHFLHYFRLTADNRLLFGGRAEFSGPTLESARRATRILQRGMLATFPDLAATPIEYAWSGHVAFTRDQMPHAGRLDDAFFAGGYCGHGIAMATYLGGLIARRIAGERFEHPLFDDHFPPIPLYHGRPWFLPLVGLYYRFRDWID
jgi:glycine/D-amino acid oxidase-like deaminating enzyme